MIKRTYPGSASLLHDLGRNVVLHNAYERIHVEKKFCDISQGILMVRGENIIMIGEVDETINVEDKLERVPEKEIYALQAEQTAIRKAAAKARAKLFSERGLGLPDPFDLAFDDA